MALAPTDDQITITLDSALGGGMVGTDTFKIEYSEDGGSTFDTAGKTQNADDYTGVQLNDATYGLQNVPVYPWVNDAGTPTIVKITITSGLCSGTSATDTI